MTDSHAVGFFDSGVGGLSVYSQFKKTLPYENTMYFGDLLHLPYGNKTKNELVGYARTILDFFASKNVKAVVIACNTSSAQAYETIKNEYSFPIFPIIQSCAKTIASYGCSKLGVFATSATVKSKIYSQEIMKYSPNTKILEISCPNWVGIVEGTIKYSDDELIPYLQEMLEFLPEKIILGCTHYPYLINKLTQLAPNSIFINPAEIFVNYVKDVMKEMNLLNNNFNNSIEEFFVSANPEQFYNNSRIFYSINKLPIVVNI